MKRVRIIDLVDLLGHRVRDSVNFFFFKEHLPSPQNHGTLPVYFMDIVMYVCVSK